MSKMTSAGTCASRSPNAGLVPTCLSDACYFHSFWNIVNPREFRLGGLLEQCLSPSFSSRTRTSSKNKLNTATKQDIVPHHHSTQPRRRRPARTALLQRRQSLLRWLARLLSRRRPQRNTRRRCMGRLLGWRSVRLLWRAPSLSICSRMQRLRVQRLRTKCSRMWRWRAVRWWMLRLTYFSGLQCINDDNITQASQNLSSRVGNLYKVGLFNRESRASIVCVPI